MTMTRIGMPTKRRSCGGKVRHRTREAANAHMQRLIEGGASPECLNVYPCRFGAHFHVGHIGRRAAMA